VDDLNRIFHNIGRDDAQLSNDELDTLLRDAGVQDRHVPLSKMIELM